MRAFKTLTGTGLGVDGRTLLEWILKEIVINTWDWIDSAQDRDC